MRAAAIPEAFFTVWANLFEIGAAAAGSVALIHGGASGIGSTALWLCSEFDVRALATAGAVDKCAAIAALGAVPINYRSENFVDAVLAQTGGQGANVILDIVGANYLESNIEALAQDGYRVTIGFLGGGVAAQFDLQPLVAKRGRLTGSLLRPRGVEEKAAIARPLREKVWPARCRPLLHASFPLARAADAHRLLESGAVIGKVVLTV